MRERLETTLLGSEHAKTILSEPLTPNEQALAAPTVVERKGHRVRSPHHHHAQRRVRRNIQQYLNVDWTTLVKHSLLCFFFGTFGGKNKLLLFALAPLLIVLQTRPVKSCLKHTLYAVLTHPPGILLSLLPAPQQAILSLRREHAMREIYGTHVVETTTTQSSVAEEEDDDDDAFVFFDAEQFGDEDSAGSLEEDDEDAYDEEDEWSVTEEEDDDDDDEYDDSDDDSY